MPTKNFAEILFGDSETQTDLYYATRFRVPDPVFFLRIRNKKYLLLNDLEVDRGRREAKVDEVISLSEWDERLKKKSGKASKLLTIVSAILQEKKVCRLIVPQHFPAYYAKEFQKQKFSIQFRPAPFWPERLLKTKEEKEAIRESLRHTGHAIRQAYQVLEEAKIRKENLEYKGEKLTSERLRRVIDVYLLTQGFLPQNTIVAGGEQAVDPHERGHGSLQAHRGIVMDVFPRSMKTQYYADMTRTVVKGKPSVEFKKMWQAVKDAQSWAMDQVREGMNGKKIHEGICQLFETRGFKTGNWDGRMQGFFHGTGHGLGLDIHEAPRVSKVNALLKEGMVITIEPGLYYKGIGGVRIEDVVYVTRQGCEPLSSCPKILSIE